MPFNEINSVEYFIIHQLSGVNLNLSEVKDPDPTWRKRHDGSSWQTANDSYYVFLETYTGTDTEIMAGRRFINNLRIPSMVS